MNIEDMQVMRQNTIALMAATLEAGDRSHPDGRPRLESEPEDYAARATALYDAVDKLEGDRVDAKYDAIDARDRG